MHEIRNFFNMLPYFSTKCRRQISLGCCNKNAQNNVLIWTRVHPFIYPIFCLAVKAQKLTRIEIMLFWTFFYFKISKWHMSVTSHTETMMNLKEMPAISDQYFVRITFIDVFYSIKKPVDLFWETSYF